MKLPVKKIKREAQKTHIDILKRNADRHTAFVEEHYAHPIGGARLFWQRYSNAIAIVLLFAVLSSVCALILFPPHTITPAASDDPPDVDPTLYMSPFCGDNYTIGQRTKERNLQEFNAGIDINDGTYNILDYSAGRGILWDYYAEDNLFDPNDVTIDLSFGHGVAEEIISLFDDFPSEAKLYFCNETQNKIYVREYNDFNTRKFDYTFITKRQDPNNAIYHVFYEYTEKITIPRELFTATDGMIFFGFDTNGDPFYNKRSAPLYYHFENSGDLRLFVPRSAYSD